MKIFLAGFVPALLFFLASSMRVSGIEKDNRERPVSVPILLYHRFGPAVADSMTVKTTVFESQLRYLRENGYTVIPLRNLVDYYLGKALPPPPRSVVITVDDGHRSVYTEMFPLIRRYRIPVTIFLYPSAISNASYAMTWERLRVMQDQGLVDFQSHSYRHPDFRKETKRLKPAEYETFLNMQFRKSKEKIEKELGGTVYMLSWPFGICNEELVIRASAAGYIAAFTMERRHASYGDNIMMLPRYLMANGNSGKVLETIQEGASR